MENNQSLGIQLELLNNISANMLVYYYTQTLRGVVEDTKIFPFPTEDVNGKFLVATLNESPYSLLFEVAFFC